MRVFSVQQNNICNLRLKQQKMTAKNQFSDCFCKKDVYSMYYNNITFCAANRFDSKSFLNELKYENPQKKYSNTILPNKEAVEKLKTLDKLTLTQQKEFVKEFCLMTGFPDFQSTVQKIENEIFSSIHNLAQQEDFDVSFIGYDSNCSVGRKLAFPGSDCDGLFMIIDTKKHKEPWYAGKIRWDFKDYVNQRILSTPANHLPEVLSTNFIEQGLKLAKNAFKECDFSEEDLKRFERLLDDNSNDFVKSAEFNIKLAQKIPNEGANREIYYKTAMLAEIIRDGVVCKNDFNTELYSKILHSPLFYYSNLMKQKGLKNSLKSKYIARKELENNFYKMDFKKQFKLIKDILYFSFGIAVNNENKKYFSNINSQNNNEMGNIEKMYDLIINSPCV